MNKLQAAWRKIVMLLLLVTGFIALPADPGTSHLFFDEEMTYRVTMKGITIGKIVMKTKKKDDSTYEIKARVDSFAAIRRIYYVSGEFGAVWNYQKRSSWTAYEDVYQGKTWQRRSYRFESNRIFVSKHEKRFSENGYPHTGPLKKDNKTEEYVEAQGYHDLIGMFYYLRTGESIPVSGNTIEYKILPAGRKHIMAVKVTGRSTVKVDALEGRYKIFQVKSGVAKEKDKVEGADLFLKTESPIEMQITDDRYGIPVKIWADAPVIGRVYATLEEYKNPAHPSYEKLFKNKK